MRDEQLLRYSRQIMLPNFDIEGQQRLLDSTVLVVGAGGLGSPVALYLAAAGIGHLVLVDDDEVELSNLQRQIVHRERSLGQPKVESAAATLAELNSDTRVTVVNQRMDDELLDQWLTSGVDLVMDACDNFATRFMLNRGCVKHAKPLVSGAASAWRGRLWYLIPGALTARAINVFTVAVAMMKN